MRTCYVIVHKATQLALPTVQQMASLGYNVGRFHIEEFTDAKRPKWDERRYQEKAGAKTGLTHYLNARNKIAPCGLTVDDFELAIRKIGNQAYFDLLGKRGAEAKYEANRKAKKLAPTVIADKAAVALTANELAEIPIEFEW